MSHWEAQPPPPKLAPPLALGWAVNPGIGLITLRPVGDGSVAVVAAEGITSLDLADGRVRWHQRGPGDVLDLTATRAGPVAVHFDGRQAHLVALDWEGERLWQTAMDLALGGNSLRGLGDRLLIQGVPLAPEGGPVCRVLAAATGDVLEEFGLDGDLPHRVPRGWVFTYIADDPAQISLDLLAIPEGQRVRLLRFAHDTRTVVGEVVVISRFPTADDPGRIAAVDTNREETLWTAQGGPNLVLGADGTHVANVAAADGQHLSMVLHALRSGEVDWHSAPVAGTVATLMLAADAVLAEVDNLLLYVFERTTGALLQTIEEPSSLVSGAYVTASGLVDVCGHEVRLLAGSAP